MTKGAWQIVWLLIIVLIVSIISVACAPTGGQPGDQEPTAPAASEEPTPQAEEELPTAPPETESMLHDELIGTDWDVVSYGGQTPLPDAPITLSFEAEELGGTTGCNHYGGPYTTEGASFSVGELVSTQIFCEGLMDQEAAYLNMLRAAQSITLDDGRLTIHTAEGNLVFEPATDLTLEGQAWTLSAIVEGEVVSSMVGAEPITATFEGGQLTGSAGCNQYSTSYEVEGSTLTLGAIVATRMSCGEERDQRERAFLTALEAAAGYSIRRDGLTLTDASGDPLLVFTASANEGSDS